jgi:hypothetical protein
MQIAPPHDLLDQISGLHRLGMQVIVRQAFLHHRFEYILPPSARKRHAALPPIVLIALVIINSKRASLPSVVPNALLIMQNVLKYSSLHGMVVLLLVT